MIDNARLLKIVDRLPQAKVILYGDLVLDRFILGTPKRISREAPVIILRHERQEDVPGGGANALANLSSLGVSVFPIGAVGDDEPGRALRAALDKLDIDTSRIITVPDFKTPTKVRILGGGPTSLKHQVARYDIEDHLPKTGSWVGRLASHMAECSGGTGAVAVSDYGYGSVTNEVLKTCRGLQSPDCWICLDSRYRTGIFDNIGGATPNLEELEAWAGHRLVGHEQVAEAAEALRQALGARFVLATRGNQGMTLVEIDREPLHIPVFGTDEVADVTGAGDTVLATLVATLAAGATPAEAAGLANIAGGLVVMKLGTATVSRQELRRAVLSLEDR
ncbi:MAG: bifunctional hydroxymethylpyrimidine kinase/phosphomethylpyrimidine kinase [Thermoanaerobaculales bacterium]|nr:bifunctional hydroxymethylpyrimidine kinase/phosphomethylpyrimidine kinase [Thermoanaerobaculales bacterium]